MTRTDARTVVLHSQPARKTDGTRNIPLYLGYSRKRDAHGSHLTGNGIDGNSVIAKQFQILFVVEHQHGIDSPIWGAIGSFHARV